MSHVFPDTRGKFNYLSAFSLRFERGFAADLIFRRMGGRGGLAEARP